MSLKDIADLAVALTFIVAAVTFIYTVLQKYQRDRRGELLSWQRLAVYQIISLRQEPIEFGDIKSKYITEVSQFSDFKIPKKEIQDSAFKLVLMSLLRDRLILVAADNKYRGQRLPPNYDRLFDPALRQHTDFSLEGTNVLSKIHDKLDSQSGVFTIHNLYDEVTNPTKYPFAYFNVLVHDRIMTGEFILKDDRIWRKDKYFIPMPQYTTPPPQQPPKTSVTNPNPRPE
jgi:hypothetical protein